MSLLIDDFIVPNGLAFSPDEKVLYIKNSRRGHIRAFELAPNGTLAKQTDRVFADLRGSEPGVPDGMKVDVEGNVYCGGAGGIWIMDPNGKKLGRIVHGAARHHQPRLRRRRLENPVLHQPQPPRLGQCEDSGHPGADAEPIRAHWSAFRSDRPTCLRDCFAALAMTARGSSLRGAQRRSNLAAMMRPDRKPI